MDVWSLALGDENTSRRPPEDLHIRPFPGQRACWRQLPWEQRRGETRSPRVHAELDAVILDVEVATVAGDQDSHESTGRCGFSGFTSPLKTFAALPRRIDGNVAAEVVFTRGKTRALNTAVRGESRQGMQLFLTQLPPATSVPRYLVPDFFPGRVRPAASILSVSRRRRLLSFFASARRPQYPPPAFFLDPACSVFRAR